MSTFQVSGLSVARFARAACRILAILSVAAYAGWSQITTGSLAGTVSDSTGTVVVGAAVKVTNQDTGVSVSLITNEAGAYKAAFLIPGT
jgi:hypothetical protein